MKKIGLVCISLCLAAMFLSSAVAESITPYSDPVFASWSAVLYSDKYADFSASAYKIYDEIKVSKCVLEQKVKGKWYFKRYLPRPASMTDTTCYSGTCDYSMYLLSGCTFRLQVTFWADGYEMTRYSSERSY